MSEEREIMEIMEIGDELRDMDGDVIMEDGSGIRKKTFFARKSSMRFKGRLLMVTKKVETLGSIKEEVEVVVEESAEGQAEHEEHHDQEGASV